MLSVIDGATLLCNMCLCLAYTEPKVHWMKGNQPIKASKYFTISADGDRYRLRISEVFPEDEGTYHCVASNPSGKVCTVPLESRPYTVSSAFV